MSEPAKDEAELLERLAKEVLCDGIIICHYQKSCVGCFAKADAAIAAIRKAGWTVVPVEPTEEMRRATWEAQLRHTNEKLHMELPDWRIQQALQARMDDPKQREMDRVSYAATLAAVPGAKP